MENVAQENEKAIKDLIIVDEKGLRNVFSVNSPNPCH